MSNYIPIPTERTQRQRKTRSDMFTRSDVAGYTNVMRREANKRIRRKRYKWNIVRVVIAVAILLAGMVGIIAMLENI